MKVIKLIATALVALGLSSTANAEYRLIVPQGPGQGTAVWAGIIAKHLEKQLGETVVVQHLPGAKDIQGFNEFHNKLRFDNKTIMVSHGGNGVSYLVDRVEYDYKNYDSIGMQNLNIMVGVKKDIDLKTAKLKIANGSGMEPDGMAVIMLLCGNLPAKEDYLNCFKQRIVWVNGLSGPERRLGFQRGELNTTRETTVAWNKYYSEDKNNILWFHHGIYDLKTKRVNDDPNFEPGYTFEAQFRKAHGVAPRGEFYEAYRLSREFRDVLQKALWVNKGNPNTEKLREAVRKMVSDPEAAKALENDTGKYEWIIGNDGNAVVDTLRREVTEKKLQTLVYWHDNAYGFKSEYKPQLVIKK
jgi:hypothetical protein